MKAFKGFNPDLSCRGFRFEEGKTFEHDGPVEVCRSGFHAVTMPLDVLRYYPPSKSIYHVVEVDDDAERHGDDSKVASRTVKVGAKIDLTGLIKAQVDLVFANAKAPAKGGASRKKHGLASADTESGAATASGESGAATASGEKSVAVASGYEGRARGALGTALFLTERDEEWTIVAAEAVIVDGKKIKADTWYSLRGGKVVEV